MDDLVGIIILDLYYCLCLRLPFTLLLNLKNQSLILTKLYLGQLIRMAAIAHIAARLLYTLAYPFLGGISKESVLLAEIFSSLKH